MRPEVLCQRHGPVPFWGEFSFQQVKTPHAARGLLQRGAASQSPAPCCRPRFLALNQTREFGAEPHSCHPLLPCLPVTPACTPELSGLLSAWSCAGHSDAGTLVTPPAGAMPAAGEASAAQREGHGRCQLSQAHVAQRPAHSPANKQLD